MAVRSRLPLMVGICLVGIVILVAVLAPWIAPYPPNAVELSHALLPPSAAHLAGTDEVGRDMISRILVGLRATLSAGLSIVFFASVLGTLIGCVSGYLSGWIDAVLMRFMEIIMALPGLVVAMALTAALGPSLFDASLALAVLAIPYYARVARGEAMVVRELNFVKASRLMGARLPRQLAVNIVPNVMPQIMVVMTLHIGAAMLAIAALSFIGLGAQPPAAELGALINVGRRYILVQWWYSVFPGIAIAIAVLGFTLLGDGLRDLLDPKAGRDSVVE